MVELIQFLGTLRDCGTPVKSTHLCILLSLLKCLKTGNKLLFQFSFCLEQTVLRTSLCISVHVNICILVVCACMFTCSYHICNTGARVKGNTILSEHWYIEELVYHNCYANCCISELRTT